MGFCTRRDLNVFVRAGLSAAALLVTANAMAATTVANATAGSLSVTESGGTGWKSVPASASTAKIAYGAQLKANGVNYTAPGGSEDKFGTSGTSVTGRTFTGYNAYFANGAEYASINTNGVSTVSQYSATLSYYNASWSTTAQTRGTNASAVSSTYDPYNVTIQDLTDPNTGLGYAPGTKVDAYFQVTLGQGSGSIVGKGESATYEFDTFFKYGGVSYTLVKIQVKYDQQTKLLTLNSVLGDIPGIGVDGYILDGNANDPNASPTDRINQGALIGPNGLDQTILDNLNGTGTLLEDLNLGIKVKGITIPDGNGGDEVFGFGLTTTVQSTPEPAAFLVLAPGLLILRKRRKA